MEKKYIDTVREGVAGVPLSVDFGNWTRTTYKRAHRTVEQTYDPDRMWETGR